MRIILSYERTGKNNKEEKKTFMRTSGAGMRNATGWLELLFSYNQHLAEGPVSARADYAFVEN